MTNRVLGAPPGWNEGLHGPCEGLPVVVTDDPYIYSYWRLSWNERLCILIGHPVRLCIVGTSMPPVSLAVVDER